jgi:hypothetical protein
MPRRLSEHLRRKEKTAWVTARIADLKEMPKTAWRAQAQ